MNEYEIPQTNSSSRNKLQLTAAVILVGLLVSVIYYETKVNKPASSESREVTFDVTKGASTRKVAEDLAEEKIIGSPTIFLIYAALHSASSKIQAGQYSLNANMNIPDIVEVLTNGRVVSNSRTVTSVEGWDNSQINDYLRKSDIFSPNDFESGLAELANANYDFKFNTVPGKAYNVGKNYYQGFLFPDTYEISKTAKARDLAALMLKNFESKISDQMLSDIKKNKRNLIDVIILASIIEKEVGRNKQALTDADLIAMQKERELVASVFYNRMNAGMALESDATVNYITRKSDRSVTIADTKIKSPFNTYQVTGLPPTPISNPGLGSIKAAINPAKSDYLYFLNAPDGAAYFAKTLAEHNANKAKYLK